MEDKQTEIQVTTTRSAIADQILAEFESARRAENAADKARIAIISERAYKGGDLTAMRGWLRIARDDASEAKSHADTAASLLEKMPRFTTDAERDITRRAESLEGAAWKAAVSAEQAATEAADMVAQAESVAAIFRAHK